MAKILTFRHKLEIGAGSGEGIGAEGFLQDGDDTLPFRTTPEGRTGLGELTMSPRQGDGNRSITPPSNRDWSNRDWANQELADLFRVKRLLDAAGVPSEIDRGLTDEGDPWFIFCGADGEVFIHLCRIDGLYVLDSPNIARPLRGVDFNALIADFTNRAVPGDAAPDERRVIRLERGGKVRLHPSALLAALIWTLFLASEELVLMAPEEGAGGGGDGLDALAGLGALDGLETGTDTGAPLPASDIVDTARAGADPRETVREGYSPEADLILRELQGQQGMALHQNGYALGLSTLAIAMGIMSETVFTDDRRKILDALQGADLALLAGEAGEESAEGGGEANAVALLLGEIEAFLDVVLQAGGAPESAESDDRLAMTEDALAFLDLLKAAARESADNAMAAERPEQKAQALEAALADLPAPPGEETAPDALAPRPVAEIAAPPAAEPALFTGISLQDIVMAWTPVLEEFTLDGTKVMASFDLTDASYAESGLAELVAAPVLEDLPAPALGMADFADAARAQSFDAQAQAFLEAYVFSEGHKFEMITFGSGVTLLDTDVFHAPEGSAYRMEWEMENGKTFSLIGLRSEFQDFDMIA